MGDSIGLARGVAEGGLGLARDVTGTALQGFWPSATATPSRRATAAPTSRGSPTSTRRPRPRSPSPASAPLADRLRLRLRQPSDVAAPPVEELPIPDYDELSASQVIERLDGLDADSLDAIRAYEASHRGRNTILGKIAQLS